MSDQPNVDARIVERPSRFARPFWLNRPVLVVGGFGFIGINLSRRLVTLGAKIAIVTPSRQTHAADADALEAAGVQIIEGDVRDLALMRTAVADKDVVFNLAARSGAVQSMDDPWTDLDVNCRGCLVLLEALRAVNRDVKFVSVGSRLEYGRVPPIPVSENVPPDPLCLHAVHKLTIERYLRLYSTLFGIRYTVARMTNPYGPGQPKGRTAYGVINRMIHLALSDEVLTIYGDGTQRRDYIYIDDAVAALLALGSAARSDGEIYNVGTGVGARIIDVATAITQFAGRGRVEFVEWPELALQIETGDFVADVARIQREIGWFPTVDLANGLRRTIAASTLARVS